MAPRELKVDVTYLFPLHTRLMSRAFRLVRWIPMVRRLWWRIMWIGAKAEVLGQRQPLRPTYPGVLARGKLGSSTGSRSSRGS